MFEYLMPALVMRSYPFTLLDQTCQSAVRRQISHGSSRGVVWGVSESAYNVRDRHLTYQYRAFGVPDLALKRGLGRDLVVAPYATALALMVEPDLAMENLAALTDLGALGRFGFRDAIEIGREHRYELYDLNLELPKPLVPRHLRFDVPERIAADGSVLQPLDEEFVRRLISCFPTDRRLRVLTSDGEFHSFARQMRRLEEDRCVEVDRIAWQPFASFAKRFAAAHVLGQQLGVIHLVNRV